MALASTSSLSIFNKLNYLAASSLHGVENFLTSDIVHRRYC